MKNVFIDTRPDGVKYVREILPSGATPINEWYNSEFASHCREAPDDVEQNWEYDPEKHQFFIPGTITMKSNEDIIREIIDQI